MGFNWTPQAEETLRTRAAEELPASLIAGELGISRNAVIGKAHRLGLQLLFRPTPAPKIVKEPKLRLQRRERDHAFVMRCEPEPDALNLTILEVSDTQCKWPVSKPDDEFKCCGQEAVPGLPYCSRHCMKAYVAPRPR